MFRKRRTLLYSVHRGDLFVEAFKQRKGWRTDEIVLKFYQRNKKYRWKPYFECKTENMLQIREVINEMAKVLTN